MDQSGLVRLLADDKIEDLKRMYVLFGKVANGHQLMREMLSTFIKTTGICKSMCNFQSLSLSHQKY